VLFSTVVRVLQDCICCYTTVSSGPRAAYSNASVAECYHPSGRLQVWSKTAGLRLLVWSETAALVWDCWAGLRLLGWNCWSGLRLLVWDCWSGLRLLGWSETAGLVWDWDWWSETAGLELLVWSETAPEHQCWGLTVPHWILHLGLWWCKLKLTVLKLMV